MLLAPKPEFFAEAEDAVEFKIGMCSHDAELCGAYVQLKCTNSLFHGKKMVQKDIAI